MIDCAAPNYVPVAKGNLISNSESYLPTECAILNPSNIIPHKSLEFSFAALGDDSILGCVNKTHKSNKKNPHESG